MHVHATTVLFDVCEFHYSIYKINNTYRYVSQVNPKNTAGHPYNVTVDGHRGFLTSACNYINHRFVRFLYTQDFYIADKKKQRAF